MQDGCDTMNRLGIVILCTNAYFILGLRFVKKFKYHYRGNMDPIFYLFSDTDPAPYLGSDINFQFTETFHKNWVDGTNSKFSNIISLEKQKCDYLFYFDADTNIGKKFDESWFIGDIVGGEHYGNRSWMSEIKNKPFERNPKSKAFVPIDSGLPQIYHYGAFFGGKKDNVIDICKTLRENQISDKKINFEPCWNDESYINHYFHYNPPKTVPSDKFEFYVSDKGGIGETRNMKLDINHYKEAILSNPDKCFDISNEKIIFID